MCFRLSDHEQDMSWHRVARCGTTCGINVGTTTHTSTRRFSECDRSILVLSCAAYFLGICFNDWVPKGRQVLTLLPRNSFSIMIDYDMAVQIRNTNVTSLTAAVVRRTSDNTQGRTCQFSAGQNHRSGFCIRLI